MPKYHRLPRALSALLLVACGSTETTTQTPVAPTPTTTSDVPEVPVPAGDPFKVEGILREEGLW